MDVGVISGIGLAAAGLAAARLFPLVPRWLDAGIFVFGVALVVCALWPDATAQNSFVVATVAGFTAALNYWAFSRPRAPTVKTEVNRILREATDANGDVNYEHVTAELDKLERDQRERIWEELRREDEARRLR